MRHLINSAVIPVGQYGVYRYTPATPEDLRLFCEPDQNGARPKSTIGYQESADLIGRLTGYRPPVSRDVTEISPGDVAMVVRLRYRVADPKDKASHKEGDLSKWEIGRLERLE